MGHASKADKLLIKPTAGARPASPGTLGRFIAKAHTSGLTPEESQAARTTQAGNGPRQTARRVSQTPERSGGDSLLGMLAWHELVERDHDLQNPTSAEKIRLASLYMRLGPQTTVLDVACGKAGPALILGQEFGCRIHGVDVSTVFIEVARRRIADASLEKLISVEITDAAQVLEWPSCDAALCLGAAFV